jgi:hypothetical protein
MPGALDEHGERGAQETMLEDSLPCGSGYGAAVARRSGTPLHAVAGTRYCVPPGHANRRASARLPDPYAARW